MDNPSLLILDGRHLLWRASSSYELTVENVEGLAEFTGGIYGFMRMALTVWEKLGARAQVVVAWESDYGPEKRLQISPVYKRRPEDKTEVRVDRSIILDQQAKLQEILSLLGIRQAKANGWEADDVIAALCESVDPAVIVDILSGDRDLLQLVSPNVTLIRPMMRGEYKHETPATIMEEWGVAPERILDMKALAGDSGDNVAGVPGIGLKTAAKLVREHGDWRAVVSAAKQMENPKRTYQLVKDHEAVIELAAKLVTLQPGARLTWIPMRRDPMAALARMAQLKFQSLLSSERMRSLLAMGPGR